MKKGRIAVAAAFLLALAAASAWVRPPRPGDVYRARSGLSGLPETTGLLIRSGGCLALSLSPRDIGQAAAPAGSGGRLFVIVTGGSVVADEDGRGPYLEDRSSGLRARAGEAIDGEIAAYPPASLRSGWLKNSLAAGWPISRRCGHSLAAIYSIARVRKAGG